MHYMNHLVPGLEVIKKKFLLNSVEHEISKADKHENIKKFSISQTQTCLECYFFLLINLKLPTTVGILTFMSRKNSMLSCVEHESFFNNLGAKLYAF